MDIVNRNDRLRDDAIDANEGVEQPAHGPMAPIGGRPAIARVRRLVYWGTLISVILFTGSYAFKSIDWPGLRPNSAATNAAPRSVLHLRYLSFHPFNLLYRMSLQTLFGLPGETIGRIPVIYSKYELEVILRTVDSTSSTSSPARNWTDPGTYVSHEPTTAYMYTAAFLTMPRSTLLYAWTYDHSGTYKLLQGVRVNVLDAADYLTMGWLRSGLQKAGLVVSSPICTFVDSGLHPDIAPAHGGQCCNEEKNASWWEATTELGPWLWPLVLVCPGAVTCFLALAMAQAAPIAAAWVFVTGFLRAICELRVLLHSSLLAWRRRPQAAVQCFACGHGVPLMLGCHALLLLRIAAAFLPARFFMYLAFHLYGTWVPLASAAIMLLALQPNNGQFLEGAMDGILHLGHRAAEDLHATAHAAGASVNMTSRSRKHWPPPVHVPAELQETAELAPKHLLCPITHHILTEPAVTLTGATYERCAIVEWLSTAGKDPLTGHPLTVDDVFPNLAMYTVVEDYVLEATATSALQPNPVGPRLL